MNSNQLENKERLIVWGLVTALFLINLLTISWYPSVWVDEVSYTDPSVNLVLGKGFVSTAWASQASTEFWASNAPLHQYLLAAWLKIFGVSQIAVRSINLLYISIASIILWKWAKDFQVIKFYVNRVILLLLLWCGSMISIIYRNGRPDCIGLLLAICILYLVFIPSSRKRNILLFVAGALTTIAGIQLPPFIGIVMLIGLLFVADKKHLFRTAVLYGFSAVAGLLLLLAFLYVKGSAYTFLTQTFASGFTITGDVAQTVMYKDGITSGRISARLDNLIHFYKLYQIDTSAFILLLFNIVAAIVVNKRLHGNKRYVVYAVTASLVIPPALLVLGRYPFYYTWMSYLIIIITFVLIIDSIKRGSVFYIAGFVACIVAISIGFPGQVINSAGTRNKEQQHVYDFVTKTISVKDTILGDDVVYYAAKKIAGRYYSPSYSGGRGLKTFPEIEKNSISKLIISMENYNKVISKIGGEWSVRDSIAYPALYLFVRK